jgi:two-component system, cell cycle sensor histidine kinase and response regulator CckA
MTDLETNIFFKDLLLSGSDFLQAVCDTAVRELGADFAFVGSLRVAEAERMYVQAFTINEANAKPDFYDVCVAPCQQALIKKKTVIHCKDLQSLFPNSVGIKKLGMESYLGCPLLDPAGNSIGIMVIEWRRPLNEEQASKAKYAVEQIASRISSEVVNLIKSHSLQVLMEPMISDKVADHDMFGAIVSQVAALAQVKSAFVAKCLDQEQRQFQILASVTDGILEKEAENAVLDYDATPCRNLRSSDRHFVEQGLLDQFPENQYFADRNLKSYFGIAFRDAHGDTIGHLVLLHDRPLSERILHSGLLTATFERVKKEIERYLIEQEHMELKRALEVRKKLQSLGLMAGTVAHDFNNLLSAIIGRSELAKDELDDNHPAHSHLEIAEEAMWRARGVISDLMDFSDNTPAAGSTSIDLNAVINQALTLLESEITSSCRIELNLEIGMPPIFGHSNQFHQIIVNFVLNAVDAMKNVDGILKMQTAQISTPIKEAGKCLTGHSMSITSPCIMLEVSDNGHGMSPETAERIFDPYFSTKNNSRGLGLAGVLGIVQRMGAGLTLTTQVGQGTVMRLFFQAEKRGKVLPNADSKISKTKKMQKAN